MLNTKKSPLADMVTIKDLDFSKMEDDGETILIPIKKKNENDTNYKIFENYLLCKYQKEAAEEIVGDPTMALFISYTNGSPEYCISAFIPIDDYGETSVECYTEPIELSNMFRSILNHMIKQQRGVLA